MAVHRCRAAVKHVTIHYNCVIVEMNIEEEYFHMVDDQVIGELAPTYGDKLKLLQYRNDKLKVGPSAFVELHQFMA